MGKDSRQPSDADTELEREIRRTRPFSEKEVLARLAGPGAMKGASPISRVDQAETMITTWLRDQLPDTSGILAVVLVRGLKGSELLLNSLDEPLGALEGHLRYILASDHRLKELVRNADIEWGRTMDERPFFEADGSAPHPEDPYTAGSVRKALDEALVKLGSPGPG